jgi:hypothetical protein
MSVAPDVPPVVYIPLRARRTGAVPCPPFAFRHLSLVPICDPVDLDGDYLETGPPHRGTPVELVSGSVDLPAPVAVSMRLTRRGQWVVALGVAITGGLMLLLAHLSAGSAAASAPPSTHSITVQAGDTLWSIARDVAPRRDPRVVVDHLKDRNHLASVSLTPGQVLQVN